MDIRRVTIVGAGTMGHGIGQEFARAGFDVVLYGRSMERLEESKRAIERNLKEMAGWDLLPFEQIQPTLDAYSVKLRPAGCCRRRRSRD